MNPGGGGAGGGTTAAGRRVRIGNRRRGGGLWWRVPCALVVWSLWAVPVVAVAVAFVVVRGYAAGAPRAPDLDRWRAELSRTSAIRAADGTVLAEIPFRDGEVVGRRRWVDYRELPPVLVKALLAAEDVRFFQHRGVDLHAIVRAARADWRAGRVVEGASTLTQQVARALLPQEIGTHQTLRRKVREALVALRLERRYSKQRILEAYANQVFLGADSYGVAAAARAYFDEPLDRLDAAQAAMLAGLAQAPGRADPLRDPAAARARRDQVLARMRGAGFLDEAEFRRAVAEPLGLRRPHLHYGRIAPWITERARREVEAAWPEAYARGGLTIETPALPALAAEAEAAARAHLSGLDREHPPEVGALVWDVRSGYVEATVGGRAWETSRFDRATQACRQPGSAFKPLVYAAALEAGVITPGTPLRDAPVAEYDARRDVHWKPHNSGHGFRGVALAEDALALSLNAPAVDVFDRVGGPRVIALARRLGITTELADVRPLVLGASCVVPLELAGVFAALARGGRAAEPVFVVRVRRGDDVLVDRAAPFDPWIDPARRLDRMAAWVGDEAGRGRPALDPDVAFQVTSMLRDVVLRGTGVSARGFERPVAGKTGTTNDDTDAWFVGFSHRVVAAVWVGHDDPAESLGPRRDGAHAALPLWLRLVSLAEGGPPARGGRPAEPVVPDSPPADLVQVRVDRDTGLLAEPGAGGAEDLWFRRGTEPRTHATQSPDFSRATHDF